jgi:hypothetical protein
LVRNPAATELEPLVCPSDVDAVFFLWVPDQLTASSVAEQCWWQLIFTAMDPEDPPEVELSVLQDCEMELLVGMDYHRPTPYLFGLTS